MPTLRSCLDPKNVAQFGSTNAGEPILLEQYEETQNRGAKLCHDQGFLILTKSPVSGTHLLESPGV